MFAGSISDVTMETRVAAMRQAHVIERNVAPHDRQDVDVLFCTCQRSSYCGLVS